MNFFLWFALVAFVLKAVEIAGDWAWGRFLLALSMRASQRHEGNRNG